jgi:hypothetical protein
MARRVKTRRTKRMRGGGVLQYLDPRYYLGMGPYTAATAAPAVVATAAQTPVAQTVGTPKEQTATVLPGTTATPPNAAAGVLSGVPTGGRRRTRKRKTHRSRR